MKRINRVLMAAVWTLLICGAGVAFATEDPAAAAALAPKQVTFLELIKQGGPLMVVLFPLSAAVIALSIYGFMIVPEKKMLVPELIPELDDKISQLDFEGAQELCAQTPSLLTNICAAGLLRIKDGVVDVADMEKAMEEASIEETSAGLKMINYLNIMAQLAPMVGLLGTVLGMIEAFAVLGQGGMGRPELLADSIGQAMVTTATGLFIGIPAMFLFFHLKGRYMSNVARLGRVLGNMTHRLATEVRRSSE